MKNLRGNSEFLSVHLYIIVTVIVRTYETNIIYLITENRGIMRINILRMAI